MKSLYVIGAPGAGKTTAVSLLVQSTMERPLLIDDPFKATILSARGTILLGHYIPGEPFAGTDTLPFNALPTVKRNLPGVAAAFGCLFVLGEGDRLACPSFFDWLAENAAPFRLVLLDAPDAVIAARRAQRAAALRRAQDESWLAGRASKVRNLAEQYRATRLDAAAPPETVAALIASALWNPES